MRVQPGDRVRVTGVMPDDPCPMEVGATGTVIEVVPRFANLQSQIEVEWDNGRTLCLLENDPFEVLPR